MTRYRYSPFSNADVRGFLEGKEVFRVPVKPQPEYHHRQIFSDYRQGVHLLQTTRGLIGSFYDSAKGWYEKNVQVKSPYQPGDIIGVREGFRVHSWCPDDSELTFRYEADGELSHSISFDDDDDSERFNKYWIESCDDLHEAGCKTDEDENYVDYDYKALRYRSPITMPREAVRIFLKVTGISCVKIDGVWMWEVGVKRQ